MTGKNGSKSLFARLKASLEEGIRHARGEVELKVTDLPAPPPEVGKESLVALRRRLKMTLPAFARLLNVPARTVAQWESGERKPTRAALRLIQVYMEIPGVPEQLMRLPAAPSKMRKLVRG
jgi:DNA-binding transcriptional regulator YiaG